MNRQYYENVTSRITGYIPFVFNTVPTITEMLNYLEDLTDSPITKVCRTCKHPECKNLKNESMSKLLPNQRPTKENLINKIIEVEKSL